MGANIFSFRLSADWLRAYADYLEHLQEEHGGHFSMEISAELIQDGIGYEVASTTFGIRKEDIATGKTTEFTPAQMRAEELARAFHNTSERLAPVYGVSTEDETPIAWEDLPEQERTLMIATATEILKRMQPVTQVEAVPGDRD